MRAEQPLQYHRKLDASAGIRREEFILNSHAQNPSQHPELLVNAARLYDAEFDHTAVAPYTPLMPKPVSQMNFDTARVDVHQFAATEHRPERFQSVFVCLVCFGCSNGGFGIVLQEKSAHSLR